MEQNKAISISAPVSAPQAPPQKPQGEEAQPPEPEAKPVTVPPLEEVDPYDPATAAKIITFFKKRKGKEFENYAFTATGDLETKAKGKEGQINLKRFLPLEPAEQAALDELRVEAIAELEAQYELALISLREAQDMYEQTGSIHPVLEANQRVADLDARRNAVRSGTRAIIDLDNPETKQVLFDQPYEERKLVYDNKDPWEKTLFCLLFREFQANRLFGKYVVDEEAAAAEAKEDAGPSPDEMAYRQKLADGRMARIFFKQDADVNGFLSPFWPVEFTLDSTRYFTALQAFEAERLRELNREDVRATILRTRSVNTIRVLTKKIEGAPADPRGMWLRIFTAVYQQHPELQERLLATGTDTLVYADDRPGPSGIGYLEQHPNVLKPTTWKGENAAGVALETLRTRLREGSLEEAPEEDAAEGVITEEEQAKAKKAAIINARRGGFRRGF